MHQIEQKFETILYTQRIDRFHPREISRVLRHYFQIIGERGGGD